MDDVAGRVGIGWVLAMCVVWASGCVRQGVSEHPWLTIRSKSFEVFSDAGDKQSRALLRTLDGVRAMAAKMLVVAPSERAGPTHVYQFASEERWAQFAPDKKYRHGYIKPGWRSDIIAVNAASKPHYPLLIVLHLYLHMLLESSA